jgi:ATP-binding cassette subfamily B (MDR/TAP) protein 1
MHTWVVTAELNGKRIRERYLQSVLRQDPTFFDSVGAGEIVTRIQTDTRAYPLRTHIRFPHPTFHTPYSFVF